MYILDFKSGTWTFVVDIVICRVFSYSSTQIQTSIIVYSFGFLRNLFTAPTTVLRHFFLLRFSTKNYPPSPNYFIVCLFFHSAVIPLLLIKTSFVYQIVTACLKCLYVNQQISKSIHKVSVIAELNKIEQRCRTLHIKRKPN